MSFLDVQNLTFRYETMCMDFSLRVEKGQCLAIIGPSGAGKSTLLNLIGGFDRQVSGEILVDGREIQDIPPGKRPVATLFQEHNLFPHLSCAQNIALGLKNAKATDGQVGRVLSQVGLSGMGHRRPGELSGGERQRAALARALLTKAPILLLDEPFSALGPALRSEMLALTDCLRRDERLTVLMVSHDPNDARAIAGSTAFVANGTIVEHSTTDSVLKSQNPVIRDYLGPVRP